MPKTKPRIAIYYSTKYGRNDGPPLYYWNALRDMGYDVTHLLPEGDTRQYGKFDLHFWIDWGEDGLPWTEWYPPKDGGKTIYVASDTHLDNGYRLKKAKRFDYVFFNQRSALMHAAVRSGKPEPVWLPHAAEPKAYPHTEQIKKYDVCFVGHLQDTVNCNGFSRIDALDRLFREFPNFYFGTRSPFDPSKNMFEDAARHFSQSRIVFNISIKDDLNMRVFETLSTGSFLLTNKIPTIGELFTDGKHLVLYESLDDLVDKTRYYLAHEAERERIARAGHREFKKHHTYQHRIKTILRTVGCL